MQTPRLPFARHIIRPALASALLIALAASSNVISARPAPNPPAPGFNAVGSDSKAIALADAVMEALGGRTAWDQTRFVTWRFFGGRRHVWDKFTGRLRFEDKDTIVLMNLESEHGRAWEAGTEVTDSAALTALLLKTKGAWINDSYWLLMPYKLKDSGVTLKYLGTKADASGTACEVLELTFENVGRTPQNKYHIFVDAVTHLVTEWIYWKDATVDEPRSLGPWRNWQRFGAIMLTADHGERQHSEIAVFDSLPDSVFEVPEPFVVANHAASVP